MSDNDTHADTIRGLRNLEEGYSLGYAVSYYAREKGVHVIDILEALVANGNEHAPTGSLRAMDGSKAEAERRLVDEWTAEAAKQRARADQAERMVEAAAATLIQAAGWCCNTRHSRMTRAQIADALERDSAALSAGSGGSKPHADKRT